MWASKKVDRLLREADRSGSRTSVVDEIVRLGETYSIVTEYTSFLVLENDAEYQRWKIDRRNLNRVGRDRAQQQQVMARLQDLREQALADLGPIDATSLTPDVAKRNASGPVRVDDRLPSLPTSPSPRSRDLQFFPRTGGGTGGGALDPISGGIALALAGLGYAARRRRKEESNEEGAE